MKTHANPPDYVFLSLVGALGVFGLIVLASASSVFSFEKFGSSFYAVKHQLIFGVAPGVILFLIASRVPYQFWRSVAVPFFILVLLLLILVLIPGIGSTFGGSRSWFTVGSFSFQPAEVAKLGLLVYLAAWLESRASVLRDLRSGFIPFVGVVALLGLLLMLQPDLGTLGMIVAMVFFLAFAAGFRMTHLISAVVGAFVLLAALIKVAPYRAARLTSFIHPELDPQGIGYHINQALLAVGSGGLFGVGFGHSRQKFRYLPEVTGDSIFPILAEELGFVISAGLIILILAILSRMFRIARDAPDDFSRFLVIGIAGWFGIQSFINIGAMLGIFPLTGLPLPFVSYGGTALAVEGLAVGIVGSISRHAK
ncbi:putative lipid II flippase FtsW [Candidatus Uhrbacteria bacterium]|nr:putative lipid II flippase FtsW [Candidatus Uhrbacteria bacterium]